jgi:hypothetical protein
MMRRDAIQVERRALEGEEFRCALFERGGPSK